MEALLTGIQNLDWNFILPVLILAGFWISRSLRMAKGLKKVPEFLAQGAPVIDVRSRQEFQQGHYPGAINLPLADLQKSMSRFSVETPIVLCCASGARSSIAEGMLKSKGYKRIAQAGAWTQLLKPSLQKQLVQKTRTEQGGSG